MRSNSPDVDDVMEDLEPETVEGPLGIPIIKPKGAPDLPGTEK